MSGCFAIRQWLTPRGVHYAPTLAITCCFAATGIATIGIITDRGVVTAVTAGGVNISVTGL
eukprot:1260093-Prymnesium_polylepis.2